MFSYFFFLNRKHGVCLRSAFFPRLIYLADPSMLACRTPPRFFCLFVFLIAAWFSAVCALLYATTPPVFEHLGSFQHFEVINSAAVNRSVHMCFPVVKVYLQSKLPEARLLRWRVNNSIFISYYQISFHRDVLCSAYLLLFNKPAPNLIAQNSPFYYSPRF